MKFESAILTHFTHSFWWFGGKVLLLILPSVHARRPPMLDRVVCPNFGHPALTSSFKKNTFLQVLQQLWMDCQICNCFSFRMVIYYFRSLLFSIYNVRKPRITKLGQGVEVRAHYPMQGLWSISLKDQNYGDPMIRVIFINTSGA